MQRPIPKIKVFIDTSVLIAGLTSISGASATVLDLCEIGVIQMVISRQVIIDRKDAPILAAAQGARVDFLVTLDKKHSLTPQIRTKVTVMVVSPAEFLRAFEGLCLGK